MIRPVSVTVVAWIIIAVSVEGLISLVGGLATPLLASSAMHLEYSLPVSLWLGGITLVVNIVLAGLMLGGFGWARIVYLVILALGLLGLVVQRQPMSLSVIAGLKVVVFGYFLLRREARQYFASAASEAA